MSSLTDNNNTSERTCPPPRLTLVRDGRVCPERFRDFVARYETLLKVIAVSIVPAGWEDAVQETYIRVLSHAAEFDQATNPDGWVNVLTRRICIDERRKQRRIDPAVRIELAERHDARRVARDRVNEELAEVRDAIETLATPYQAVLHLRLEALSAAVAASYLGITVAAYRSCLARAFESLRNRLGIELAMPPEDADSR